MDKEDIILRQFAREKWIKLGVCIVLDLVGNFSYLVPIIGDLSDFPFATFSGLVLTSMFWKYGKGLSFSVGLLNISEEMLPVTDIIPSSTLMWLLVYVKRETKTLKIYADSFNEKSLIVKGRVENSINQTGKE